MNLYIMMIIILLINNNGMNTPYLYTLSHLQYIVCIYIYIVLNNINGVD